MKDTKLILKILTGVMAAALLGGILFIASSFMGNPITAMLANKAVKHYVEQNYSPSGKQIRPTSVFRNRQPVRLLSAILSTP